jgi:hypothetical protein
MSVSTLAALVHKLIAMYKQMAGSSMGASGPL